MGSAWLSGMALLLYSVLIFFIGLLIAEANLFGAKSTIESSKQLVTKFPNRIKGFFSQPDLIQLDISHKNFQKLAYKREVALLMGRLMTTDDDYVPATLRRNQASYDVKLRLKGDWLDHLEGEKWSYRVKVKNDASVEGLRVFSIQHPKTRNFLAEWVYHQALKREDVLSLRYDFAELSVNGKNLGIFAIEEHFNKILVEHNKRREGPIIRMDEDVIWDQLDDLVSFPQTVPLSSGSFRSVAIDAFESSAMAEDSTYHRNFIKAISLLEAFRTGEKVTNEVFDIDHLAAYVAISELMGAQHSAIWNNMRFYYNPVTTRLEPIGFDGLAGTPVKLLSVNMIDSDQDEYRQHLILLALEDPLFKKAYLETLKRVSSSNYLDQLYADIDSEFERKLHILYKEFPAYEFPFEAIEQNRRLIHFALNPKDGIRIHVSGFTADSLLLEIGSTQAMPVQPVSLILNDSLLLPFDTIPFVTGRKRNTGISFTNASLPIPAGLVFADSMRSLLQVNYRIIGNDSLFTTTVLPHSHARDTYLQNDVTTQKENTDAFSFLIKDDVNRRVSAQAGSWRINHNLILPAGYTFFVPGGTSLDLRDNAMILAKGAVMFAGSKSNRVRISSSDSTGQGLVVLKAGNKSSINHTIFEHLSSVNQNGWVLTGGVSFYESEVVFKNTTFDGARSEDALNLIRTSFEMDSVVFSNTMSDAFDGDFVEGSISNALFVNTGNDGIDVSGSTLNLQGIEIRNAGDKAFSAGEFSVINGRLLTIYNSEIAIASKDQSIVHVNDVVVQSSRVGVAIYQKKPEFGPASIESNNFTMQDVEVPMLIEEGSLCWMNGKQVPADQKRVADLMYGNVYGTASE
ncbi:MAG: CotH kinase family protein [Rhodothermales bacterium]